MGDNVQSQLSERDIECLKMINQEKINFLDQYSQYTLAKISFISALLGIGSFNLSGNSLASNYLILVLIPIVAICFDSLIISVDLCVVRIGMWYKTVDLEHEGYASRWEEFVRLNPIDFRVYANFSMSIITVIAALIYSTILAPKEYLYLLVFWFTILIFVLCLLYLGYFVLKWRMDR